MRTRASKVATEGAAVCCKAVSVEELVSRRARVLALYKLTGAGRRIEPTTFVQKPGTNQLA